MNGQDFSNDGALYEYEGGHWLTDVVPSKGGVEGGTFVVVYGGGGAGLCSGAADDWL